LTGLGVKNPVIRISAGHYASPEEIIEFLKITKEIAESTQTKN
jgi:selenocysteine lyase/cysteine desulfurase